MNPPATRKKSPAHAKSKENTFPVVAIGASAGGLEAMMELLKYLPADTGMAFIYVQHLSPDHKSMLTEILSKKTRMIVQEIDDMDKIKPDNVFVIPYNKGIEVTDGHIQLIPRSDSSAAITIDILFSSLAEAQKERVIGIILSGSASDGTVGMQAIKQQGGLTFAQDDTAKFTGMPHSAIAAGTVDYILSPKEIALEIARLSKHPLLQSVREQKDDEALIDDNSGDLKNILYQVRQATGVDFSAYKMNTIKRRIIRRMVLYKISVLKEYATLLSHKKEEIDILYQDLLINVTSFFRDTDTHKYLKETLFPKLLKRKKTGESLRLWVPACATGEEAYSLAMMVLEIQESKATTIPVQIFATDLSEQAIRKARIGIYTKQELESVSPKRIQRFFSKAEGGGFRVNKAVRDMCVFAPHNILRDPPFSRLDFISCCNLFIYLDIPAQKKAVMTFHYALQDSGYLMLGKSENITQSANLFTAVNKKYKIFSRKNNPGIRTLPALLPRYKQQTAAEATILTAHTSKSKHVTPFNYNGLDNAIDAVLVSEFMPASVVINHQMEIVQFRGTTDVFLTHPKGRATFNILKMARPEIAFELRNAIAKVIRTKHRVRKSGIELKVHSAVKIISLELVPLAIESDELLILIVFTEQEQAEHCWPHTEGRKSTSIAKDRRIKKLEQEVAAAHADALAIAQEQEAFAEELQSANEEIVSSNEELQTVNEELETSKEEIESANEELTTTNQELQTRNDLLNEAYNYSEAVFATIHEPMLVLDKHLRVKSANKTFYTMFNVKEAETEGMLLFELGNKQWNIPRLRELLEDILPRNSHFHDFEITHTFPFIGEKTMLLNARRIIQKMNHEELILLAISDVTEQTAARRKIEESEERFRSLADNVPMHIFIIEPNTDATISYWNNNWLNYTGQTIAEALGNPWEAIIHPDDVQSVHDVYLPAFEKREPYFLSSIRIRRYDGEYRWHSVTANPRFLPHGEFRGYIGVGIDIHESKLFEKQLIEAKESAENATKFKQQFLSNMSHEIRTPLNSILGFANVLLKTQLGVDQQEFAQAIKTSGTALNLLINDILDLAKVDAGRMTFEKQPFDIRSSINSLLYSLTLHIQEKNIALIKQYDNEIPVMVIGDAVRLNQIILNLIGNAIKFTPAGTITLSVNVHEASEHTVTLEFAVTDTGIGIAAGKVNRIFTIFEQAETGTTNSYGGTGLGLAIVKQLVESQAGSISVQSKIGEGSTFSFILTFGRTSLPSAAATEIVVLDSEITTLRVLVVEDVALNQLLIKIILSGFGFDFDIAGNGKIALEKLQTGDYDIILMDLQMPEMNGFETTEYIRKTLHSPIPIIALTADVSIADASKCKEFGMDDYIPKPIDEKLLHSKIVELVKIRRQ